ncbi:MAG: PKD domain-containing protein [Nitrospirota bacterium]
MLKFKEPVAFMGLDFDPSIVKNHPVMIVPSGGFYGLENSEILRAKLDEYVKNGGTLIVFAQQHGYEFSILPVPQETDGTYNTITGYGWTEDQSCLWNGTYVETYHQILSAINTSKSSANVDGYFISYPSNSTIFLRRTANGQPAMLMYEYGNGRVIVSSLFSDWGYTHSQATQDEVKIVRDMVSWAKKPDQLPEIKQGETVSVSVSVKNNVDIDAASVKFIILDPDRNAVDEQTQTMIVPAGQSTTIPVSYTSSASSALGSYHIDYILLDAQGNIIQPQAETDSGRFVVSNPPSNPYKSPDFNFSIQSDAEYYIYGSPVTFTVIAWNNTSSDSTLTFKYILAHLGPRGSWRSGSHSFHIPANASTSFNIVVPEVAHQGWLWGTFYDETEKQVGYANKGIWMVYPSINITAQTEKLLYGKGETVLIHISLKNNTPASWQSNVKVTITDSQNTKVFEDTKTVNLSSYGTGTVTTSFALPLNSNIGSYAVKAEARYETRLFSSAFTRFELPQSQISIAPNLPATFTTGSNTVSFVLNNTGKINVSSGTLDVSLKDPDGSIVYSGSQPFALAAGESKALNVSITVPSLKFGNYTLTYSHSDETGTTNPAIIPVSNTATIDLSFDKSSYRIREESNLTVSLMNSGKFNLENVSVTISIPDVNFTDIQTVSLSTNDSLQLTYTITISESITPGQHNADVTLMLPSGSSVLQGSKFTIPDAFIKIEHTGEKSLTTRDVIDLTVGNTGGVDAQSIIEIKLTSISDAFTIYQDFISDTIQAGTSKKYSFQIPLQARSDGYVLDAKVSGDVISTALLSEIIDISGIAANLLVRVDKDIFLSTENIISLSQIVSQTFGIDNANLHLQIVNKCASEVYVESYHISTWDGTSWVERGVLHYPETFETQNIDLSEYLPDVSGEYKVRISNLSIYAYVDYIGLIADGVSYIPNSAIEQNSNILKYITEADDYAANIRNLTAEIRWTDIPPSANKILSMRARELGYNLLSCQEQLYWQTDIPVTIASDTTINTNYISGPLYGKGQFYLQGKLLSSTGQVIANAEYPFSVIDGDIALRIQTGKNVYRPGETVVVAGVVNNLASIDVSEIKVEISDNNEEIIYSETFNISANGSHPLSFTTTAGTEGVYRLSGKVIQNNSTLIEISDRYEVAKPNVSVSVNVPEVADKDSFNINVEIKNEGKAEAVISLQSSVNNQIQEMIIPAGETRLLQYTQQITGDLTYTFTFTGDIDQTITKTVLYGLSAAITITSSNVYPEGKVAIPITIINIGQLDEALNVDFILQPSTLMQTKTYYIKAGSSTTDTLYYDLKEGSYQLSAISQQPAVSAMVDFSVRKENEVETSISLGAQTGEIIPATVNLTNVGYNNIEVSVQLSAVSSQGQIVWNGSQNISLPSSLTPIPYTLTFNINPSAIVPGNYTLKGELLSNSNQQISISSQPLIIQGPVFQITQLPSYQIFNPGQEAIFTFKVKNTGNQEGGIDFNFKAYDLVDLSQGEWLLPGEEKTKTFSFMLPEDLEEKDYFADYEFKSISSRQSAVKGQIKYHIAGIHLNVNVYLDKQNYIEGDIAKLTIFVDQSSLGTLNLFARVNYNGYESQVPFTLSSTETLAFDIPLTEITGEKLFYGIYHESGRSIHLNSLYIYKVGDILTIMTDKQGYNPGETVSTTISSTSEASGTLTLSAPNYEEIFAFLETATKSFVLPSTMTAGTYFINAQLSTPNSELITVMYPFDVAGISVKVKEATLDKGKYATSDTLNTSLTIESNQDISATLKAWIVDPEGKFVSAGERNISLSSSDNLLVTHNSSLVTAVSGIHRLVYGIYAGDLLLVSGSEAFDVGDAILTGISTNKTDYPTNTEFVNVTVSMYGTVDAILELQLDGDTIRTQPIALNGFSTLDIDVGTVKPGTHALKAILSAGGLKSTKETTFTYALSLLDSDNDGMPDEWETAHGLDPNNPDANLDPDNDGLPNLQEYQHGTDPNNPDTDSDGMPDGWEVTYGLNPNANDASSDKDNDGFSNLQEYQSGSNPADPTSIPNQPPVANAGADQNVITGTLVTLNGSESFDPEGVIITFLWTFVEVPAGDASLSDAFDAKPTFTPAVNGTYRLELVINDGVFESVPDEVAIIASTQNVAPNANAGPDQNVYTGATVYLDGSGSIDPDSGPRPLSYLWSFDSVPGWSFLTNSNIDNRDQVSASFIPDIDGSYVINLTVNDGELSSWDTLNIMATTQNVPPNANAGTDITVHIGEIATLDGSASNDPDDGPSPLSYSWIFVTVLAGSQIGNDDIVGADSASPSFTPDVAGTYVLQLTVSDGLDSAFDNIAVTVIKKATFCSILGNDPKPSILDQDIFKFNGIKGETVTIRLESDPAETGSGKRVTLLLMDNIKGTLLLKLDRGVLPNEISAKLPATGEYLITVAEQPKIAKGERYRGAYCLSLEASHETMQTLKPAFWVE